MYKIKLIVPVLIFLCFVVGCGSSGSNSSVPIFTNPIIQNDDYFMGSHWNDPHVLNVAGQFIMYASSDVSWDGVVKIYRFTSSDGVTWSINPLTPVLEKSATGWDSYGTETPAIVYFQGNYHLFYTGYDVAFDFTSNGVDTIPGTIDDDYSAKHFKVGHAISADGINFVKQGFVVEPTAPYIDPNFDFNQYVVGEPAPVVYNNKLYLYFTAIGSDLVVNMTWQVIGLMTYDGATWDTPRAVLKPDLTLYPRNQYIGYSTPNAVLINNTVHLYYDVALETPWTQVKIHHAYSTDAETNWVQDATPLLEREDYSWTAAEIRSPSALVYNNNLYLYFAGHVLMPVINLAIGLEVLPVP